MRVEVCYALPQTQQVVVLELPEGATLGEALRASGLPAAHRLDAAPLKAGIFGRLAGADTVLRDGDRVEIYRPLTVDAKTARRRRAEVKLQQRKTRR